MSSISSRGAQVVVCSVITVFIATIAVFLRFFTRRRILHVLGYEDWCILAALFFSFGNTTGMIFQTEYALGHHVATISESQLVSFLKAFYFTVISYNFSLSFTKIAILLLYLRIFTIPKITRIIYIQLVIVTIYGLWLVLCAIFACTPISLWWDKSQKGTCLPSTQIWWANATLNIATDFMIFLLPLPVIRTLNLPKRQKMGLYFVFTLGFFVCIVSIIRLYLLHVATSSTDSTWDNIGIANWSCIELNTGITCACLTTLKPLISHFFPGLLSTARTDDNTFPPNSRYIQNTGTSGGYKSKSGGGRASERQIGMGSKDSSEVGIVHIEGGDTEDIDLKSLESEREGKIEDEERGRPAQSRSQTPSNELSASKKPGRGESWLQIDEENLHSVQISAQTGKVTRVESPTRGMISEGKRHEGWVQGWPASDGSGKGVIRIETVVEQSVS